MEDLEKLGLGQVDTTGAMRLDACVRNQMYEESLELLVAWLTQQ